MAALPMRWFLLFIIQQKIPKCKSGDEDRKKKRKNPATDVAGEKDQLKK